LEVEKTIAEKLEETLLSLSDVYELLLKILSKYMDMKENDKKIVAYWILAAIFREKFQTFPYLFINATKGSGKSRLLKLVAFLLSGDWTVNLTDAVLFREKTPLMIDETENISKKEKSSLRELLNVAYKKGGVVKRVKKVEKTGEAVVETFNVFRPIMLANIDGLDDVLEDRCITIILEKSYDPIITRRVEYFEIDQDIKKFKEYVHWLSVGSAGSASVGWSTEIGRLYEALCYVINNLTYIPTQPTPTCEPTQKNEGTPLSETQPTPTQPTLPTLGQCIKIATEGIETEEQFQAFEMMNEIIKTNLLGRDLELWLPLFTVSFVISKDNFLELLKIAQEKVNEKVAINIIENRDIKFTSFLATFIQGRNPKEWILVSEITKGFLETEGEKEGWIRPEWVGKALRRLGFLVDKRRRSRGVEVILNFEKINETAKKYGLIIDEEKKEEVQKVLEVGKVEDVYEG
jgi:hypothetical protein